MQPQEFAVKWRDLAPRLTERAAYQEHWRDLCALLGERGPTDAGDPDNYAFEKHVKKAGTGETGFADVFRRGHFIAEYKGHGKSLGKALQQALLYARELDNPPLLIVSDLNVIEIHTNFTGSSPRTLRITLDDIERDAPVGGDLTALQVLRAAFRDPGRLDPRQLRERVTQDATAQIGQVAQALAARGTAPIPAAHFLMRVVFAMFAEDVGLLNGDDLMDVRGDTWVIDFASRSEEEAAQYLVPHAGLHPPRTVHPSHVHAPVPQRPRLGDQRRAVPTPPRVRPSQKQPVRALGQRQGLLTVL
ncbi:hypothetical protein IHN32_01260, partial [Deinococcus sp. 14RED07]|uniref:type IIL restriction-modification enzyme MmeI n=1 Tax=Deinococcus sp. 14RED07 TaxID=2745874 RepID=UPI00351DA1A5|nr:hypothetical protein [Deinococcus sp. 14RED07]